ncbi:dNA gyrase subunit A [Sesbania bispinosa]|nr:dNA gyrase subunit A [Sesbania bispinosa]
MSKKRTTDERKERRKITEPLSTKENKDDEKKEVNDEGRRGMTIIVTKIPPTNGDLRMNRTRALTASQTSLFVSSLFLE